MVGNNSLCETFLVVQSCYECHDCQSGGKNDNAAHSRYHLNRIIWPLHVGVIHELLLRGIKQLVRGTSRVNIRVWDGVLSLSQCFVSLPLVFYWYLVESRVLLIQPGHCCTIFAAIALAVQRSNMAVR